MDSTSIGKESIQLHPETESPWGEQQEQRPVCLQGTCGKMGKKNWHHIVEDHECQSK
jgi:hypothetical protein